MLSALALLSLLVQLANVGLIARLVITTGRRLAWMFIAVSMILAAVLRFVTVLETFTSQRPTTTSTHEILVIVLSTLLMIGLYLIKPLLESIRATERAVMQSEAQYQALFRDSPLSVIVLRDGRIEYANHMALGILGAERLEQVGGRQLTQFVEPRFHAPVTEQLGSLTEAHPTRPITEVQVVRLDGTLVDVEILIALFIYGGNLAEYIILWDVSDRKRREETLREREAELAHVMRRHTMGEIAAEMAHEINQPLYAISNFAQAGVLHLQSGDPERLAQLQVCLEHIYTQAGRAAQIVKNLRNFVSKSEVVYEDVSLNQLVRDAIELVAIEARRRRVHMELKLDPRDVLIHVNPVSIQQVLVNLLVNAYEALENLPNGNHQVKVSTCVDVENAEIAVEDSGPGIEEDQLKRVFEPFFSTKSQGMGMGLAVSRTIVMNHGGKIWAERNDKGGTTFRITLPLKGPESHLP